MTTLRVTAKNSREVSQGLARFKLAVRNRIMRGAMGVVSRRVAGQAKDRARVVSTRTRQLWRSMGQKVKTYKNNAITVAVIGPRRGFDAAVRVIDKKLRKRRKIDGPRIIFVRPTKYAHLVERGTKHSRAKPFLDPTFRATEQPAQNLLAAELRKRIATEAAKVRAK